MHIEEIDSLLTDFLFRWTIEDIRKMTLEEYVGINNKDTFCQWVETKTRPLGSIKGMTSIKFGIYERKNPEKEPKKYKGDKKYSWIKAYGDTRKEAFENTKTDIIKIIKLSEVGKFEEIEDLELPNLFKWKVAYLYSNDRLIPIFNQKVLFRIANHFGLQTNRKTKIYQIQNLMMMNKPAQLSVHQFMRQLYNQFSDEKEKKEIIVKNNSTNKRKCITRKATNARNIATQTRKVINSYLAQQKHNKIQEALANLLTEKYGKENVLQEENYVDIKLIQPDCITFFEVKSASYASDCIKLALGQILLYSLNDTDVRPKKLVVVGQYAPTEYDIKYIDFLKKKLKVEFDYLKVNII